ncbi:MAG TPA: hypothetical protein VF576_00775, partial [Rubricoccaceae bacterium]
MDALVGAAPSTAPPTAGARLDVLAGAAPAPPEQIAPVTPAAALPTTPDRADALRSLYSPGTRERIATLDARPEGQRGDPAPYVAALPPEPTRTAYERDLAAYYARPTPEAAGALRARWGDLLEADEAARRAPPTVDVATGRPIDDDPTWLETAGRTVRYGVANMASGLDSALGQGLDALGVDEAGAALQARARELEDAAR